MEKIKIAQIGTSETTHSAHIFQTIQKMQDVFETVGFADVDKHTSRLSVAFRNSPVMTVEEILNYPELDAVVIDCDEEQLTKYAILAAQKGLPVLMDKPGGVEDEEFDRLIDIVEKNNQVFSVSYMYRFNPAVVYIKKLMKEGKLGEIFSIEAQMNCYHGFEFRKQYAHLPDGLMYYLGCHLIDLIYSLQGEPKEVIPLSTGVCDKAVTDFGMAVLKYENGVSMAKTCSAETDGWNHRSIYVSGTKGTAEISPLEEGIRGDFNNTCTLKYSFLGEDTTHSITFKSFDRYKEMLENFARLVRGEKQNEYSYQYERQLHKLLLRACGR